VDALKEQYRTYSRVEEVKRNGDSIVDIATGYGLDDREVEVRVPVS
jgi:hypothetical protein